MTNTQPEVFDTPHSKQSKLYVDGATWGKRALYAVLTSAITLVLIIVATFVWQAFFSDPPVHIETVDSPYPFALCPGQKLVIHNRVTVDKPVVLFFYVSVMDKDAVQNINDTQVSFPGRIHPQAATFDQFLPWTVPSLPPGNYMRALAVRGTDGDEKPVILLMPFAVGDKCRAETDPDR